MIKEGIGHIRIYLKDWLYYTKYYFVGGLDLPPTHHYRASIVMCNLVYKLEKHKKIIYKVAKNRRLKKLL